MKNHGAGERSESADAPAMGPRAAPPDPRDVSVCVVCGGTAVARKCKIICRNCGYTRDCGDP